MLDFAGNPVAGAEVDWGYWTSLTNYVWGGSNMQTNPNGTPANGSFAFDGVTGGHQQGDLSADDLRVWYNPTQPGSEEMEAEQLDFATTSSYPMQPAEVNFTLAHGLGSPVEVRAGNSTVGWAFANVPLTGTAGVASVLPMSTFNDLVAYYQSGEAPYETCHAAVEWLRTPISISAGELDTTASINLDWNNAQYAELAGPLCQHSGAPGSSVHVRLWGWPDTEQASFVGYNADGVPHLYGTTLTSQGAADTYSVALRIDAKAPVGPYQLDVFRSDDLDSFVQMWDNFQVCTFKASSSSIRAGRVVRLSGKAPGAGKVTLFATTHKVSGQPASLAAKGWTRLGTYKSKSGAFITSYLHPKRTTYYVVRYDGYAFEAFTSVVKVTVR